MNGASELSSDDLRRVVDAVRATRQYALVRIGVSVLAHTDHSAARVCADALDGHTRNMPRSIAFCGDIPVGSLRQAASYIATGAGSCDALTIADITRAAIRAAGWDAWLTALVDEHQLETVNARTTLELVRSGVNLDDALAAAAILADTDPR